MILFPFPMLELSLSAGEGDAMLPVHLNCLDQKKLDHNLQHFRFDPSLT